MTTVEETASDVGLRRLPGPAAIGASWRRFAGLWWRLTKTDWALRYQGSVLGVVWAFLGPLLFALVLYAAFSRFLRFGGEIANYQAMLIVNIIIFGLFAEGTGRALNSFISKGMVIRQLEVPRLAIPLASVGTVLLTVALSMVPVLLLLLVIGVDPSPTWVLLPALLLGFVAVVVPVALIVSVMNARFRDVSQIWTPISRALFYASPVLFPIEIYPESWQPVLLWNPLAPLLATTRQWIVDPGAPSYSEAMGGAVYWLGPAAVFLVLAVASVWVFRRHVQRVAEDL
jgi:ABC-2 type transport system permease protein